MAVLSRRVALWYLPPESSVQCLGSAHCLLGLPWLTSCGLRGEEYKWTLLGHVFDSTYRRTPRHTDSGEHSGNRRTHTNPISRLLFCMMSSHPNFGQVSDTSETSIEEQQVAWWSYFTAPAPLQ
jgi:hypothetical protein